MSEVRRGTATGADGQRFWFILDPGGRQPMAFDHDQRYWILAGARVEYIDANDDGIAEHVEAIADIKSALNVAKGDSHRFGRSARKALRAYLVTALCNEQKDVINDKMGALRDAAKASDGVITVHILRENGILPKS